MPTNARFNGAFNLSELIALDTAYSDECAVLILRPSAFAVLGWLSEIVFWERFIQDDVSVDAWDRTGDQYKWRIFSEMAYTIALDEKFDLLIGETARIADNLEGSGDENLIDTIINLIALLAPLLADINAMKTTLATMDTSLASLPGIGTSIDGITTAVDFTTMELQLVDMAEQIAGVNVSIGTLLTRFEYDDEGTIKNLAELTAEMRTCLCELELIVGTPQTPQSEGCLITTADVGDSNKWTTTGLVPVEINGGEAVLIAGEQETLTVTFDVPLNLEADAPMYLNFTANSSANETGWLWADGVQINNFLVNGIESVQILTDASVLNGATELQVQFNGLQGGQFLFDLCFEQTINPPPPTAESYYNDLDLTDAAQWNLSAGVVIDEGNELISFSTAGQNAQWVNDHVVTHPTNDPATIYDVKVSINYNYMDPLGTGCGVQVRKNGVLMGNVIQVNNGTGDVDLADAAVNCLAGDQMNIYILCNSTHYQGIESDSADNQVVDAVRLTFEPQT